MKHLLFLLLSLLLLPAGPLYAQEDNLSTIRFLDLTKQVEEEKKTQSDKDLTGDSDNRVIELLRLFKDNTRSVVPIAYTEEHNNTLLIGSWVNYWQVGSGRQYEFDNYEWQIFLYGEQMWNNLENYSLLQQNRHSCDEDPVKGCIRQSISKDLEFTISTFGVGGTIYYLRTADNDLSLGIEAPLFAAHQLRIRSRQADKNYRINGISILGIPIYRHSVITPFKLRYKPGNWFSMTLSLKYATMTAFQQNQDDYAEDVEGEWINDCRSNNCNFSSVTGNLGMEIVF